MDRKDFQQLAEKISNGIASEKEVALYNHYYNKFQQDIDWDEQTLGGKNEIEKELYARIKKDLPEYKPKTGKFLYIKIATTAAILLMIMIGLLMRNQRTLRQQIAHTENHSQEDIAPGTNKAILTLSDGTVLNLDESQDGLLAKQGTAEIKKTEDGKITYATSEQQSTVAANVFNTITIPAGGQYQLTLPDGSKVWLNSSSSLKFPVAFTKESREVELEGEAYFEVASISVDKGKKTKKRPFIVKTPTQQVEVLGTHFNVNAYANEQLTKTTLIEGSVKILSVQSGSYKMLRPGQQTQMTKAGHIHLLENIDTEEAVAWKNGMFYFHNTDLSIIMKQLARWYNVEVDIQQLPQKKFNGELPRNVKLSQVLQMMETTSGLKFKIEERRISMVK